MGAEQQPELNGRLEALEKRMSELEQERHALLREMSGEQVQDYALTLPDGTTARLSDFFGEHDEMVLIHNMGISCPYCTLWAEGFRSTYPYIIQRAGFLLVSEDAPETQAKLGVERDWSFPMATAKGTSLFVDLGFSDDKGSPWPGVSTLRRNADGSISRISRDSFGPGDRYCNVFAFFDLLSKGEGEFHEWFMPDHEAALQTRRSA